LSAQPISATAGASAAASTALKVASEEATESAAAKAVESAKGDGQEARTLAAQQRAAQSSASPDGVGKKIDVTG
jgi:hypothetical protein